MFVHDQCVSMSEIAVAMVKTAPVFLSCSLSGDLHAGDDGAEHVYRYIITKFVKM